MDFSDEWESAELADAEVVLKAPASQDKKRKRDQDDSMPALLVIRRVPAHKLILSRSPYFRAQVLRWQRQQDHQHDDDQQQQQGNTTTAEAAMDPAAADNSSSSKKPHSCVVYLTLESAEQELAAMYGATAPATKLTDQELLQMALIADMLTLTKVAAQAVQQLCTIARSATGMSAQVQQELLHMRAWPSCLRPVFPPLCAHGSAPVEHLAQAWVGVAGLPPSCSLEVVEAAEHSNVMRSKLLDKFQDLYDVWADAGVQQQLLALPLPAMQLLLSSNSLQVPSEDMVLYTAQRYVDCQTSTEQQQAAMQQLAPLIRCPRLATMWLTNLVTADDPSKQLLGGYLPQIKTLLGLHLLNLQKDPSELPAETQVRYLDRLAPGAPSSWLQQPRTLVRHIDHVSLTWNLPMAHLKATCVQTAKEGTIICLTSPTVTPPLYGVAFQLQLLCDGSADDRSTAVGIRVRMATSNISDNMFVGARIQVSSGNVTAGDNLYILWGGRPRLIHDQWFGPSRMAGGWEKAAWNKKGLPSTGTLPLKLRVRMEPPTYMSSP